MHKLVVNFIFSIAQRLHVRYGLVFICRTISGCFIRWSYCEHDTDDSSRAGNMNYIYKLRQILSWVSMGVVCVFSLEVVLCTCIRHNQFMCCHNGCCIYVT